MSYKLIISQKANSSYQNTRKAYKNNKAINGFQLSLIDYLTQIKARKTTNTSRATLDLELCNYIEN
jgi:hypothetical protein